MVVKTRDTDWTKISHASPREIAEFIINRYTALEKTFVLPYQKAILKLARAYLKEK